ncbi:MAG TPA: phosphate ABC transporter permease subunit PstC [Anaerohalosphaeraceae bacterium]|nr:phosphate ABC transporter permease subunit PstC [Anaerohalosphaeraceae bacterium]
MGLPNRTKRSLLYDRTAAGLMGVLARLSGLLVVVIAAGLFWKSVPILKNRSFSSLLFSSEWYPLRGQFGFLPFIMGSLWVTGTAMILAVPLCLLTAIYLAEYAPRAVREGVRPLIDLLAGIPSVVYGVWGVLVVVPWVKRAAGWFGYSTSGYCVLSAGIVLAVMIFPVIIHMTVEILRAVPQEIREASLSLGATQWQTIKKVVLRKAFGGVLAAIVLGLSRAFGETMAVLMVAGNAVRSPTGFLDAAYPLPALIANNYGEMMSIPLYDSAMMLACLILLGIVLVFNVLAKLVLMRIQKEIQ